MPGRRVEYSCKACEGSGLVHHPCHCCAMDDVFPWYQKMVCESCTACSGTGITPHTCGSCQGTGKLSHWMWLPDNVEETWEMLSELEQCLAGKGAWLLVDAIRRAHEQCTPSCRDSLIPQTILERVAGIAHSLPPRCSHCNGRGFESVTGASCVYCRGDGCCQKQESWASSTSRAL